MLNTSFKIDDLTFKNPVMTASGTFGSGNEYGQFVDLNKLGAVVVKGVSLTPWEGNDTPRVAEVYGGIINSVGLQNGGVHKFIKEDIPFLRKFDTNIIVNICGHSLDEYVEVTKVLIDADIDAVELNISCPNVKEGCLSFGTDAKMVEKVVSSVKKVVNRPLIVKLTPNVTDITEIAKASESSGASAISLINTITAMKIDIHKREPVLYRKIGGMSGPAIKPIAIKMVYEVSKCVNIPIIGMGGILNGDDAIEFILAGASGVAVGTANFMNPLATIDVLNGIENYMNKYNIKDLKEIRGIVK